MLEGELTVKMRRGTRKLPAGSTLEVPRAATHRMWNSSAGPTRAIWQTRPALRTGEMFAAVDALRRSGHCDRRGQLTPLAGAVIAHAFPDEIRLPLPWIVQRPLIGVLAALGRRRGWRPPA